MNTRSENEGERMRVAFILGLVYVSCFDMIVSRGVLIDEKLKVVWMAKLIGLNEIII